MSPHFNEMADVAKRYCELIETMFEPDTKWLEEMAVLLPRLHAAVAALATAENSNDYSLMPDLDARFELYARLRRLLGNKDSYWMAFDVAQDGQSMSGSLADDLTDIYCELKHGLRLVDHEPSKAMDDWCSGFRMHWGQHLMDAERHLYELKSQNQL